MHRLNRTAAVFFDWLPRMLRMPFNVIIAVILITQNIQSIFFLLRTMKSLFVCDEMSGNVCVYLGLWHFWSPLNNKCKPFTVNRSSRRNVTMWFIAIGAAATTAATWTFITHFTCLGFVAVKAFELFSPYNSTSSFVRLVKWSIINKTMTPTCTLFDMVLEFSNEFPFFLYLFFSIFLKQNLTIYFSLEIHKKKKTTFHFYLLM